MLRGGGIFCIGHYRCPCLAGGDYPWQEKTAEAQKAPAVLIEGSERHAVIGVARHARRAREILPRLWSLLRHRKIIGDFIAGDFSRGRLCDRHTARRKLLQCSALGKAPVAIVPEGSPLDNFEIRPLP